MRYVGSLGASCAALGLILCSIAVANLGHIGWALVFGLLALMALFFALWQYNRGRFTTQR